MENNVSSIDGKIGVVIIKEGDYFIANSPALDLSSFGKTEKKAISNFKEAPLGFCYRIFIEKKTKKRKFLGSKKLLKANPLKSLKKISKK